MGTGDAYQVQVFFFFFFWLSHYDWPNPKEKTPHILKVTQYKNLYPRWVVGFFSKSYFVLITFMNVISKHGNLKKIPLQIWQNLQNKSQKDLLVAFAFDLFFDHQNVKFTQTNHWRWPPQTLKYPTPLLVPPKSLHETGYTIVISQFLNQHSRTYWI